MGRAKGADILFLRKQMQKAGEATEKSFLDTLSPDDRQTYHTIMAVSWIPIETNARFQHLAASILFPGDPQGLQKLGCEQAKSDLGGIYRILLKIVTIPTLLKQISKLWKTYNDQGVMSAKMLSAKEGSVFIAEYPELPAESLANIEGYIRGSLEMAGATQISVKPDYSNPNQWTYQIRMA